MLADARECSNRDGGKFSQGTFHANTQVSCPLMVQVQIQVKVSLTIPGEAWLISGKEGVGESVSCGSTFFMASRNLSIHMSCHLES